MLSVIILAGGNGSRLTCSKNKVLTDFAGKSIFTRVCEAARNLNACNYIVVVPRQHDEIIKHCPIEGVNWVVQDKALGTGHAVRMAMSALPSAEHKVLILCADVPLIETNDLVRIISGESVELLTAIPPTAGSMGRIKRDSDGLVNSIVEAADASKQELAIKEVFSGIMQVSSKLLTDFLPSLASDNKQNEYYLTDIVSYAVKQKITVNATVAKNWWSTQGINTIFELTELERVFYHQQAQILQAQGVRIIDPNRFDCRGELECKKGSVLDINVIIRGKVTIGAECYIGPNVYLENCQIADRVKVLSNSVIKNSAVASEANIGPFSYIRPDSKIEEKSKVGSFVEIKASKIGRQAKVAHLSYIGDTSIGAGTNIGAGVITCNYDGKNKHKTIIGSNCFIGAGVQLVAPLKLGDNSFIGSGTCIRNDVPGNALAVNKQAVKIKCNWEKEKT